MARQYKNARKRQKLIVKDAAAKLDISPSTLGAWESERKALTMQSLGNSFEELTGFMSTGQRIISGIVFHSIPMESNGWLSAINNNQGRVVVIDNPAFYHKYFCI